MLAGADRLYESCSSPDSSYLLIFFLTLKVHSRTFPPPSLFRLTCHFPFPFPFPFSFFFFLLSFLYIHFLPYFLPSCVFQFHILLIHLSHFPLFLTPRNVSQTISLPIRRLGTSSWCMGQVPRHSTLTWETKTKLTCEFLIRLPMSHLSSPSSRPTHVCSSVHLDSAAGLHICRRSVLRVFGLRKLSKSCFIV